MKIIAFGVLGMLSFLGALALGLGATGNLNRDALDRVRGVESALDTPLAATQDSLSPLAQQLRQKEESLRQRDRQLNEREQQLARREEELAQVRNELEQLRDVIDGSLGEADTERRVRMTTIAITLTNMRPKQAAQQLNGLPVEDVAEILLQVERPKDRGAIMQELETDLATQVLRYLQHDSI